MATFSPMTFSKQGLALNTAYLLSFSVTATKAISRVDVDGLLVGLTSMYTLSNSNLTASVTISGSPKRLVASGLWTVTVVYTDGTTEIFRQGE